MVGGGEQGVLVGIVLDRDGLLLLHGCGRGLGHRLGYGHRHDHGVAVEGGFGRGLGLAFVLQVVLVVPFVLRRRRTSIVQDLRRCFGFVLFLLFLFLAIFATALADRPVAVLGGHLLVPILQILVPLLSPLPCHFLELLGFLVGALGAPVELGLAGEAADVADVRALGAAHAD